MSLPINPGDLAERNAMRGCRSCSAFDGTLCRKGAPTWQPVQPSDWCEQWTWRTNPRVTWNSAICEAERRENADLPPF